MEATTKINIDDFDYNDLFDAATGMRNTDKIIIHTGHQKKLELYKDHAYSIEFSVDGYGNEKITKRVKISCMDKIKETYKNHIYRMTQICVSNEIRPSGRNNARWVPK